MNMKKWILLLTLSFNTHTLFADDSESMNISKVITSTLNEIPACLEYKVKALVVRCVPTPYGCHYIYTLKVSHNSPDLLFMTHEDSDKSPWSEWSAVTGKITGIVDTFYKEAAGKLFKTGSVNDVAGGRYMKHNGYGDSTARYYDATVVGHVGEMVMEMIAGSKDDNGSLEGSWTDGSEGGVDNGESSSSMSEIAANFLKKAKAMVNGIWDNMQKTFEKMTDAETYAAMGEEFSETYAAMGEEFLGILRGNISEVNIDSVNVSDLDAMNEWGEMAQTSVSNWVNAGGAEYFTEMIGKVSDYASSVGYSNNQSYLCPVGDVDAFMPYYLSSLDGLEWRMGFPFSDMTKTVTIGNPLSGDRVGPSKSDEEGFGIDLSSKEVWGNIYPREGTVNVYDSRKGAAVIASRASSILFDKSKDNLHIRWSPNSDVSIKGWSLNYPVSKQCRRNIANTVVDVENNEVGNYAWTGWNDYTCYLNNSGFVILEIPVEVYITSKIPE